MAVTENSEVYSAMLPKDWAVRTVKVSNSKLYPTIRQVSSDLIVEARQIFGSRDEIKRLLSNVQKLRKSESASQYDLNNQESALTTIGLSLGMTERTIRRIIDQARVGGTIYNPSNNAS